MQVVARALSTAAYLDKPAVTERVLEVVKKFQKVEPAKVGGGSRENPSAWPGCSRGVTQVSPTSTFQGDLGLDSLDTVEVVMALEEEFSIEIPDSESDKLQSISEAIAYIASNPHAK